MPSDTPTPVLPAVQIRDALQQGRPEQAERLARDYLKFDPANESARTLLALSFQFQGKDRDAADVYGELTRSNPRSRHHWTNFGNALRAIGATSAAENAYLTALQLDNANATVLLNLGYLYLETSRVAEARTCLLRSVSADPGSIEARIFAAGACYECGDNTTAERLLEPWRTWTLKGDLLGDLGWNLFLLDHPKEAEALLRDALLSGSNPIRTRSRLVVLLEKSNQLEDARALFDALPPAETVVDTELRAAIVNAHATLILRSDNQRTARSWFEDRIHLSDERKPATFYFSLAKICDKLGDVDSTMRYLTTAHAIQMELVAKAEPGLMADHAQALPHSSIRLTADEFNAWPKITAPSTNESPIFVVGFPRSGTTLLEQMLDAHPALKSMDERLYLAELADRVQSEFGLDYPHELGKLTSAQCDALRDSYWHRVADAVTLDAGQRLVDKNPLNMLHLPMIQRIFPNAQLIFAMRHPCDVLFSCYMQNFRLPAFMMMCSTLEKLAAGYVSAMDYWRYHSALMKPNWMTLRYEDLVSDFRASLESLAQFLHLDDPSPMAAFDTHARNKGYIATPSYDQVIQPVNSGSVFRWRRYKMHFAGALPALKSTMQELGYAE